MAEIAVNLTINKLGDLLVQETKLLKGIRKQVQGIKGDLQRIRAYLKDADAIAATEEGESNLGMKTWMSQLREEAYHIEDVIDKFSFTVAQLPHDNGLVGILHKVSRFIKKMKLQHGIATEIADVKITLAKIHQWVQFNNFRSIEQESSSGTRDVISHDSRVGSFFTEDTEVVDIESTRDELIDFLVNGKSKRSVIAVVGEGGLGKTTLAGKIYNNDVVKGHFDCQAWITVGKEYMWKDLLMTIIQELCPLIRSGPREIEKMEEHDLIVTLREFLKDKCYMVVFDDVWNTEFWEDVKHALINNKKSSRVMLTTRNEAVAYTIPSVNIHVLGPLPYDKAWGLFCRKAFGSKLFCPPELERLSHDILAKCGGLPLAIVAVGGLLSNKNKVVSEWQKFLDRLGSKLGSDPHLKSFNRVLSEGYYDLPPHLKSCLLYFGLFPESYSIKLGRLIRLWIAEGFVQYSKNPPSEQVAEEYLTELIDRSLVQVSDRKVSGRAGSCRVHDLMYEIILKKTQELGFCQVLNGEDLSHCNSRRIAILRRASWILGSLKDSKIRSLSLSNVDSLPKSFATTSFADFRLIKVLDFEDSPVDNLPGRVGNLFHLRYLSLKNTRVKNLPKSIGMLFNLETLDLKWSFVTELPIEIRNLKKLGCLLVRRMDEGDPYGGRTKIHEGFGALTALQKLSFVHADSEVLEELWKLRQLRLLHIRLKNRDVKDLFAIVKNLENLEHLGVEPTSEEEILDVQSLASPPQCLRSFYLRGNIMKLPNWISELQNLIKVELSLWRSIDDALGVLQALPNLLRLILKVTTYCDEQLHLKEGWFPKLKVLILGDFKELKLLVIDKGAMPNLTEMEIGPCPQLKEIPIGIEHLRNLKKLVFRFMLKEIYYMMKEQNWEKVTKHISEVCISYKQTRTEYFYYTSQHLSYLSPEGFDQLIKEYITKATSCLTHL